MTALLQDLRYALRAVGKRPSYAVLTVLVLVLSIGANATVFGVFNAFYLRPLPYPDDDRLVMVFDSYPKMGVEDGGVIAGLDPELALYDVVPMDVRVAALARAAAHADGAHARVRGGSLRTRGRGHLRRAHLGCHLARR